MRLSFITLFVPLLSLAVSIATNPQFLSRHDRKRSPVPSGISSRQYRVPRSLVDLCINVNLNLFAGVDSLLDLKSILGPLDLLSKVHLCLCLKDLDIYLATNSEIQSLIYLLGPDIVGGRIRAIINTSPHARKCTFPQRAHHTCNTKDPCHWACDENYVRDGDKCVCAPPFISCNDVCGLFPKGCSSAVPRSLNVRTHAVLTLSQAKASCKLHETVCGIAGREDSAFECIDTTLTKDSCGGCLARHPFREANPVHEVSGQDCTRILNVRNVGCSHSRCIVTSCQEGWIPNANNTGCLVDLAHASGRISRRSDSLSINVTASTVVDSEVLTKLVAIVDAILHLYLPPSASSAAAAISYGVSLLNDVNTAAANLVTSNTIRAFVQNVGHLLDVGSLLKSWLSSCHCVNRLGLSEFVEEVNSLVVAIAELRTFCFSHPVVSGPQSHPTVTGLSPSATVLPDHPFAIRPSDLLAGLRLDGEIGVINQGRHDSNNLLSVLGLGLDGHHSPTPNIDLDLSDKIAALAHLVIGLQSDLTAVPLVGRPTSVNVNLVVIGQATKNLLNATRVSDLMASLEHLVALSDATAEILENCGCINSLSLQQLDSNLNHLLGVAWEALTWCHSHPVVPGSNTPPFSNTIGGDVPVVVGLSDLLNLLTLDLLPISTTTVEGLGGGLSNTANDLLDSLGVGPHNAKRDLVVQISARNLVDSNLLSCLEVLVNLVAKLQVSITLALSTGKPCVGSPELACVKEMVDALTCITPSTTTPAILISVTRILAAESLLENALQTCSDAETIKDLVGILVETIKVTLQLGDLCGSSNTTLVRHSTALPSPTTSLIVTSWIPTTPFFVTLGRPTTTSTLPTAVPTRPASSDDEIIVALNRLLSTLGLGGIKGVVTVEGLGHGLNEPVNSLLDGLQIGPHDLRRREKRQVVVQSRLTHLTLQADVDALVDLFVTLRAECGTLNCINLGTPQRDFFDASLQEVVGVLSATSWSKFVGSLEHLTTASVDALKLLDQCECIAERNLEEVYKYVTEVVDASLALQRLCWQMDTSGTKVDGINGQPIVVGLARLLKGLGIEGRSGVILNNLSDSTGERP